MCQSYNPYEPLSVYTYDCSVYTGASFTSGVSVPGCTPPTSYPVPTATTTNDLHTAGCLLYSGTATSQGSLMVGCDPVAAATKYDPSPSIPSDFFGPTATPQLNLTLSKIPVNTGNMTGDGFVSAIIQALKAHCPYPSYDGASTTCDTDDANVDGVKWLDGEDIDTATITFNVGASGYIYNWQIDSMIAAVAQGFNGSTSGNCVPTKVNTCHGGESEPNDPLDVDPQSGPDCSETVQQCQAANFVDADIFQGGSTVGKLYVEAKFHVDGMSEFDCELTVALTQTLMTTLDVVEPELTAELAPLQQAFEKNIMVLCEELAEGE